MHSGDGVMNILLVCLCGETNRYKGEKPGADGVRRLRARFGHEGGSFIQLCSVASERRSYRALTTSSHFVNTMELSCDSASGSPLVLDARGPSAARGIRV